MRETLRKIGIVFDRFLTKHGIGVRAKLIVIFLLAKVLPMVLLTTFAWQQINHLGGALREIAVTDATEALNAGAVERIERISTDTAQRVANFLYDRDADIRFLASVAPDEEAYRRFAQTKTGRLITTCKWTLSQDGRYWTRSHAKEAPDCTGVSTNEENNDMDGFSHRQRDVFNYIDVPLYDEINFVDLQGNERIKVTTESTKTNYPMAQALRDVSIRENTYVKAESYFAHLGNMQPGDIYVSDVIGAYVPSNYIGMYTPDAVAAAADEMGYDIAYDPQAQAYAGMENPNGQRFEGIIRWATPVAGPDGEAIGYVTFALNHDHIMKFVDHLTPMDERYSELPSAYEDNYAFIWDADGRNIGHPRHHSIVGYDPATGDPQIPWLESSIYDAWQASGIEKWTDFMQQSDWPPFDSQSRDNAPAPALTKAGLVGLDGRYLNNAPQCTGWMDLTGDGGSGSFYMVEDGRHKLTSASAIPYYTGPYAPSQANDFSYRGFGIVTIDANLEDLNQPVASMQRRLADEADRSLDDTFTQLWVTTGLLVVAMVLIAFLIAGWLTGNITRLIKGIYRFRAGERQFRFNDPVKNEFGVLADAFDIMADGIEDSVRHPLVILDMNKRIVYMNKQGLAVCRTTLDQVVGKPYVQISAYPPGSVYSPITALEQGREAEIMFVKESGLYVKGSANYFLSKSGRRLGYIVESQDVTELSIARIELEEAVQDAKRASEHKGDFLARMSHEIRTPMNAIMGVTGIIQKRLAAREREDPGAAEIKGYIDRIDNSSQHLLGLLDGILDLSKIEAGKIELAVEPLELARLAEAAKGMIDARCAEKKLALHVFVDDFAGKAFLGDALRLRQVLINLLGNAVKFTPENGSIWLRIDKLDERPGEALVRFSVRDTGEGISQKALRKIFEPFEQENSRVARKYGGTGLGLSISQNIVQMMDSELAVESELGKGSEFRFQIWMRESDVAPAEAVSVADIAGLFAGKKMLLVDDVQVNRLIVAAMLEDTAIQIDEADDGTVALSRFKDSRIGEYDIVLMDIQMPGMNGYETSREIRALAREDAQRVPIVALTANAFKEDRDRVLAHQMNAHVAKPVEPAALIEVLARYLTQQGQSLQNRS